MSTTTLFFLITLLSIFVSSVTTTSSSGSLTAYDILKSYGFPGGLLPKGVTGYVFNEETGDFKLFLPKTCKFHIESYEVEYEKTVSWRLTREGLYKLKGVSVKLFFFWLNIVEVRKVEDELQFSAGIASANFPIDGFEESPQCGCGSACLTPVELSHDDSPLFSAS